MICLKLEANGSLRGVIARGLTVSFELLDLAPLPWMAAGVPVAIFGVYLCADIILPYH